MSISAEFWESARNSHVFLALYKYFFHTFSDIKNEIMKWIVIDTWDNDKVVCSGSEKKM